ncbi:hypothetical protein ACFFRR_010590 [Megaselia abdita]
MKILVTFIVAFVAFASALPKLKVLDINDHLKPVIPTERLENIQNRFELLNGNNARQSESECLQEHLDNITKINDNNSREIYTCSDNYLSKLVELNKKALITKEDTDDEFYMVSRNLVICENIKDAEKGLQCQADLKSSGDKVTKLSSSSKKALEELQNSKDKFKIEKSWCINDSVNKANKQIEIEHNKLMDC